MTYLAVTKLNIPQDKAIYEVPVCFIMLMLYELARLHDSSIFTLIEREAIDGRN